MSAAAEIQGRRSTAVAIAVVASFAATYLLWGSTFLAIRLAVETLPPLSMIAVRSLVAGAILYGGARAFGAQRPTRQEWQGAILIGTIFFLGCHGLLAIVQRYVASGVAAVVMATIPIWTALFTWLLGSGRPSWRLAAGLGLGLAGVVVLVAARGIGHDGLEPIAALLLVLSAMAWAAGTALNGRVPRSSSPFLVAGMQLLAGGVAVGVVALVTGEASSFSMDQVSWRSVAGLIYLILIGSVVTFGAYIWVLRVVAPAKVATYAFVNPVVAVLLGWAFAGETLSWSVAVATALVLGALLLIMARR